MGVKLKVSRMDPFETYDASALAMQLAEALQNAVNFQSDSEKYAKQAELEHKKAKELQVLIKRVHERDKRRAAEAATVSS